MKAKLHLSLLLLGLAACAGCGSRHQYKLPDGYKGWVVVVRPTGAPVGSDEIAIDKTGVGLSELRPDGFGNVRVYVGSDRVKAFSSPNEEGGQMTSFEFVAFGSLSYEVFCIGISNPNSPEQTALRQSKISEALALARHEWGLGSKTGDSGEGLQRF